MKNSLSSRTQRLAADAEASATAAGLRYVSDAEPGIRRRRCGRGFTYLDPAGERVSNDAVRQRIAALAIPPAWQQVWICPLVNGHLQATGRDRRVRKQYRYHQRWHTLREQVKFDHILDFAAALPGLRQTVADDLKRSGFDKRKIVAAVVRLLELTLIRVGNDEYAAANSSYGLTTLENRHLTVNGSELRFEFVGKSGKYHRVQLQHRRLAAIAKRCHELPGQRLFQYVETAGGAEQRPVAVDSADVNEYLRQASGREFTAKDFRTWAATVAAGAALAKLRPAELSSEAALKRELSHVVGQVARHLGNTPAVCRRSYIHPALISAFMDGRFRLPRRANKTSADAGHSLSPGERAVLDFLRRQ